MSRTPVLARMYSRASWGARYRAGFGDRSANYPLGQCWTHHSVTAHLSANATVAQEKQQMRILEDIGQQRFGGGISYTFIIFPSGRAYHGLGASRIGAHTINRNSVALGVCFAGNYENHKPTAAAEATYAGLLQDLQAIGVLRRARTNGGHRDVQQWNACPGRHLYARIPAINRLAAGSAVETAPIQGEVMPSTYDIWSYTNTDVDPRQVYAMLRNVASDVIWDRTYDYANPNSDNPTSLRHQISRAHQYAMNAKSLNDRRLDYVNSNNPTTARHQIAKAHQYAMNASQRAREANQKIDAVAEAVAELVGQIDQNTRKALEDKLEAIKVDAAQVNAAEVAAELEVSVKEDGTEGDD